VTVNTVANYRSINSEKMVFSTDDVMQSMITEVISKFQQAISHMTTLECLQGCQVAANDSVPLINEALARFGIMIEQLIVEEVAIPDAIAEKNLQIITAQRTAQAKRETSTAQFELDRQSRHNQHELQMAQERHARDLRAAELERERLENEHHQRLEEVNAKTRATIIGMEVASEADRTVRMAEADLAARKKQSEGEASRYASLIKAGVTMQDLVSLEQVKAAGMLAQNANVMYLPNELVVPSLWGGLGPMGGSGVGPATRSRAKAMAAVGVPSAPTDK
jgi:regulator of protease activity HflC (stomatin/prohibitin superfamily)